MISPTKWKYTKCLSSPKENKIDSVLNCNIMGAEQFKNVSLPAMCEGIAFINVAALQWKLFHVTNYYHSIIYVNLKSVKKLSLLNFVMVTIYATLPKLL